MNTMVGLYGNTILQAHNLAQLLCIDNKNELGDLIALMRGCLFIATESTSADNYKVDVTFTFEGAGKQFYVMTYVNKMLEDILEFCEDGGYLYSDVINEVNNICSSSNPYLNKLNRKARLKEVVKGSFDVERDEDGHINLTYLYAYQDHKSISSDIYNSIFLALKYEVIKQIENNMAQLLSGSADCRNNCLTLSFPTEGGGLLGILTNIFTLVNDDELMSHTLSNIKVTIPSDRDIDFVLPNITDTVPEYASVLYECDYILYCDSEQSIKSNKTAFLEEIKEKIALAPDTKIDYILIKDDNQDDAVLAKSLVDANDIPVLKSLVGGSVGNMEWSEDPNIESTTSNKKNNFFQKPVEESIPDSPTEDVREDIVFSSELIGTPKEKKTTLDFSILKQELSRVGLNGFNVLKIRGWDEDTLPLDIEFTNAKSIKTDILDDYDVAKVSIGTEEILMYCMDSLDLKQIPISYIEEHKRAELKDLESKELKRISDAFTAHNISSIEKVLTNTKEHLLGIYSKMSEKEIRDCYIKIVLSDICEEFYDALKTNIINTQFDYNIDDTKPDSYISANFKITLLQVMFWNAITESRKYWQEGIDDNLRDENYPNIQIMSKLLENIL